MRVLYILKTSQGAAWAYWQAAWLHQHGVEIIVVLPDANRGYALRYRARGIRVIEADLSLSLTRPWLLGKKIRRIRELVKTLSPDLIHCHFVTNIMMVRLALRGTKNKTPRLFQVPGPLHLENLLTRKAELMLSGQEDYWAGACRKTYGIYLRELNDTRRVFLAYYGGYGGSAAEQYRRPSGLLAKKIGAGENDRIVGMVSMIYKPRPFLLHFRGIKGHEDFIDAIRIVRKRLPEVRGVIIGGAWKNAGRYEKRLRAYAQKTCPGGITFTGFERHVRDVYRELDVAVHPSHSENLGGAAESLAAGVPTVATDIGGFPDIVIHGATGLLCRPADPKDLAEKIEIMLLRPREAECMAARGRALIMDLLNLDNTADRVLEIYREITGAGNG